MHTKHMNRDRRRRREMERKGAWKASIKEGPLQERSKKRHIAVTPIKEVDVRSSKEEEVRAITSKSHTHTHLHTCIHAYMLNIYTL